MPELVNSIPSQSKKTTTRNKSGAFQAVSTDQHIQVLTKIFGSTSTGLRPKDFKPLLRKEYSENISKVGELLTKELQRFYIEHNLIEKKAGLLYLVLQAVKMDDQDGMVVTPPSRRCILYTT